MLGVTSHKWLPNTPVFLSEPDAELKVCDLINQNTGQWDRGKILATFTPRTYAEILATPLNHLDSQDVQVWTESKDRNFSVKTAYQVAIRLKSRVMGEHSMARVHGITWSRIWKPKVPSKVRTFLWRACSNCLPTRDNLCRRKIQVVATCEFCHQEPETVSHILWSCPFARNVWALVKGRVQKCSNETVDFFLLFKYLQKVLDGSDLDCWAITAWSIWNARNKFYFEHTQLHPWIIMERAAGLLSKYQMLTAAQHV